MKNCQACNASLPENAKFCTNCGAKSVVGRLTLSNLLSNLFTRVLNLDFSFLETTKRLFVSPESATVGYIKGVRKIISSPIQYALIILSLYGLFQFLFSDFLYLAAKHNFLAEYLDGYNSAAENSVLQGTKQHQKVNRIIAWMNSRNQFFLFLLVPVMALLGKLFYKDSGYNYAEQLVVFIYAISLSILCSITVGLVLAPFGSEILANYYHIITANVIPVICLTWVVYKSFKEVMIFPALIFFLSYFVGYMGILLFFIFI